jgi:hypothetical protein
VELRFKLVPRPGNKLKCVKSENRHLHAAINMVDARRKSSILIIRSEQATNEPTRVSKALPDPVKFSFAGGPTLDGISKTTADTQAM